MATTTTNKSFVKEKTKTKQNKNKQKLLQKPSFNRTFYYSDHKQVRLTKQTKQNKAKPNKTKTKQNKNIKKKFKKNQEH